MTIVITAVADSFGRKILLILGAVLMAIAGWVFAISSDPCCLPCCDLSHHEPFRKGSRPVSFHRTGDSSGDNSRSTPHDCILPIQSHRIALRRGGCISCRVAVTVFNFANYWLSVSNLGYVICAVDDGRIRPTITGHREEAQNSFAEASNQRTTIP